LEHLTKEELRGILNKFPIEELMAIQEIIETILEERNAGLYLIMKDVLSGINSSEEKS
jgi:hypothetical protein